MKKDYIQKKYKTDILVIGGGFAGVFAAIRARSRGQEVILVDKGDVGRSGQTPWGDSFYVFDEEKGHKREDFINALNEKGLGVNNIGYAEMLFDDSKAIFEELKSWGAVGEPRFGPIFKKQVLKSGAKIIIRTMITHLIKDEAGNRVIGAMGFSLDEENTAVIIETKAVINCAGAGCYKSNGFPIQGLTFDGDAISYRVGAEITGKEYNDFHGTNSKHPGSPWHQWGGKWGIGIFPIAEMSHFDESNCNEFNLRAKDGDLPIIFEPPFAKKTGKDDKPMPGGPPPVPEGSTPANSPETISGKTEVYGGGGAGLSIHKAEGVFPKDGKVTFESCIEGLYAAGDALGSMMCGPIYPAIGFSTSGSCVQGARASIQACEYCDSVLQKEITQDKIDKILEEIFFPIQIGKGYSPRWVIQQFQNIMMPFYILLVKEQKRMEYALFMLDYIKTNLIPKLYARDTHDLKLAHEAANMILNAEMKMRASLFRTESRGTHYREDYPERDDANWKAWTVIRQGENGEMKLSKFEIK